MRRRARAPAFIIRPVPPFRLDLTVWALRRRARNLVDRWDGTTYRRVIVINGRAVAAFPSVKRARRRRRVSSWPRHQDL
jgi:hypothetical protein